MKFYPVMKPGAFLNCADAELSHSLRTDFSLMDGAYVDANIALNLFQNQRGVLNEKLQAMRDKMRKPIEAIRSDPTSAFRDFRSKMQNPLAGESEAEKLLRITATGREPYSVTGQKVSFFARMFVYSVDEYGRALSNLVKAAKPIVSAEVVENEFKNTFRTAREIRNSEQHIDERLHLKKNGGSPIQPKAVNMSGLNLAKGSAVVARNTSGDRYGCTVADGSYLEIEINEPSMVKLKEIHEHAYSLFKWTGAPSLIPSVGLADD